MGKIDVLCVGHVHYSCIHIKEKFSFSLFVTYVFQAYRKLAKEYHPDKNPNAGDKVRIYIQAVRLIRSEM